MLVPALLVVSSMVLRPQGLMEAHTTCLEMMYTIQVIIMFGNSALPHLDLLEQLLDAHHQLYMMLYPQCQKPKLHYGRQMARMFRRLQCVLTCFSAERYHRRSKRVAANSFKCWTDTCRQRLFLDKLSAVRDAALFHATKPSASSLSSGRWKWMFRAQGLRALSRHTWLRMAGPGWVKTGDFVLCRKDEALHVRAGAHRYTHTGTHKHTHTLATRAHALVQNREREREREHTAQK
jgi:hypothetical protein